MRETWPFHFRLALHIVIVMVIVIVIFPGQFCPRGKRDHDGNDAGNVCLNQTREQLNICTFINRISLTYLSLYTYLNFNPFILLFFHLLHISSIILYDDLLLFKY